MPKGSYRLTRLVQLLQNPTESGQPRSGDAGFFRVTERFEKNGLQLERLAPLEINQGGSLVRAHRAGALDLLISNRIVDRQLEAASRGNHFKHEFTNEFFPAWVRQQFVCGQTRGVVGHRVVRILRDESLKAGRRSHTQAVERNIPHQLFPMGSGEVVSDFAGDSGMTKSGGDFMCARLWPALKFTKHNHPMIDVMNDPR